MLASMNTGDRSQWLRVGVAHVEAGIGESEILCVHLGAIPMDHWLYIPLGDVLASRIKRQPQEQMSGTVGDPVEDPS
jgi:hypothetical protein